MRSLLRPLCILGMLATAVTYATTVILPPGALQDLRNMSADTFKTKWPGQQISDGSYPIENGFWATYQHANLTYFIGPYSDTNTGAQAKAVFEDIRQQLLAIDEPRFSSSRVGLLELRLDLTQTSTNPPPENLPPSAIGKLDGLVTNPVEQASASTPPPAPPVFTEYHGGLKPTPRQEYEAIELAYTPFPLRPLPVWTDMSKQFPPIGQQGGQNSCTAWTIGYALKSFHEAKENGWSTRGFFGRPNWKTTYSPAFLYNQTNGGADQGAQFPPVLAMAQTNGVCRWLMMPYNESDFTSAPSSAARSDASKYILDFYGRVPSNVNDAKAFLAAGFPLITGLDADTHLEKLGRHQVWKTPIAGATQPHAVMIIGYDDRKNAFKIFNSWGRKWATDGFGWIDYSLWPTAAREVYVTKDALNRRNATPPNRTKFSISLKQAVIGKQLAFSGTLQTPRGYGRSARVEVRVYENGKPLRGWEPKFQTVHGQAATISSLIKLPNNREMEWTAGIPSPPNFEGILTAEAILFVDGYGIQKSSRSELK